MHPVPRWTLASLLLVGFCSSAWALPTTFGGVLQAFQVGQPFSDELAANLGFELAETVQSTGDHGKVSLLRFERDDEDSLSFVEVSATDRLVQAVGWSRVFSKPEADSAAAQYLGAYARLLGFPDDLVADEQARAVAWIDKTKAVRFELILQQADEGGSDWELTAVLRRE